MTGTITAMSHLSRKMTGMSAEAIAEIRGPRQRQRVLRHYRRLSGAAPAFISCQRSGAGQCRLFGRHSSFKRLPASSASEEPSSGVRCWLSAMASRRLKMLPMTACQAARPRHQAMRHDP